MAPPSKRLTRSPSGAMDPQTQALIENLEILNGARGKGMDRAVLVRDLVDLDLAKIRVGAGGVIIPTKPGTGGGAGDGEIQVDPPEVPRGVKANGGFSTILVEWDKPSYSGHAYTEILRSDSDNFSTAVRLSTTAANLISDQVGYGKTYYYWVRFVNLLDVKGPVQSTNGVRGQTQEDIGDILDKLQGQIDESFLTPEFNSKLTAIGDLTKLNEHGLAELEGKVIDSNERVDILSAEAEILAEAALEAATGVDNEGIKRRKVTAEIKLTQKTIVSDLGAQATQILEITARVDNNFAAINETKNAVIKLDSDTKQAVESITQRLDSQKSEIDQNKSSITSQSETLVLINNKVEQNSGSIGGLSTSITSITNRLDSQESQIGANTANITSQGQTIVTVSGVANSANATANQAKDNAAVAASKAAEAAGIANGKGKVIIQSSEPATADRLEQNLWIDTTGNQNTPKRWNGSSWVVVTDKVATDAAAAAVAAKNAADAAAAAALANAQKIEVVSETLSQLQSTVGTNTANITTNSQTLVIVENKANAANSAAQSAQSTANAASTAASNAQSTANAANASAISANGLLSDIASDNKLTPSEKQEAKKEWDIILSEKPKIEVEGNKFAVSIAAYNTAYNSLSSYITPLLSSLSSTSDIIGSAFRLKFKDYYDARQDLLNAITSKAKALADAAQSSASTNGQQITVMSQQLTTLTSDLKGTKSQVTQNSQTIATIDANGGTAYQAQWGVKASIGDIVAGIGLTVKKEIGKPDITQCTVIAGQFSVGVASTAGADAIYPFIVANHPTTGVPGVFIDTAYIKAAKIQDLVAGEVIADNIRAAATLTSPYIKGGRIEIGSRFTVDENGNMVANDAIMTNATVSGIVNANGGVFNNVTINENCDVKGTIYANKIVGDVYNAFSVSVAAKSPGNNQTVVVYSGTIPRQNFARKVEFGGVYVALGAGAGAVGRYYLNNVLVHSFDIYGASGGSSTTLPGYITTLNANTDAVMRMDIFTGYSGLVIPIGVSKIAAFKA